MFANKCNIIWIILVYNVTSSNLKMRIKTMDYTENNKLEYNWTRINNDVNGNPRYVIHHLVFVQDIKITSIESLSERYPIACNRAREIGGKKFHNKQYGGGIVFQSYNLQDTEKAINNLISKYI